MNVDLSLWREVIVLGVSEAGMYALLPIALVLSYRVSRTIAFVHGGIAGSASLLYWFLVYDIDTVPGNRPELPPFVGFVLMVLFGAAAGAAYGVAVTRPRVAKLPGLTLTVISLGVMLLAMGIFSTVLAVPPNVVPPAPFGTWTVEIAGVVLTALRVGIICIATVLIAGLGIYLVRSRAGRHLQAMSDDLEASEWCGIRTARMGSIVQCGAGAVSGMAGALITAQHGPSPGEMIQFLLRGLAVAIIGGLMSLPLALAGALLIGIVETGLVVGMVGPFSVGNRELVLNGAILVFILVIARMRPHQFYLLERQSL